MSGADGARTGEHLAAPELVRLLAARGYDFYAGVPCSFLAPLFTALAETPTPCLPSVREDEALGVVAGAYLAGARPVVLLQNSGLGTGLNALVSLEMLYEIPVLLVISWRGHDGHDAPEHIVMGRTTTSLLDMIGVPYAVLGPANVGAALDAADAAHAAGRPFALIVREGGLA